MKTLALFLLTAALAHAAPPNVLLIAVDDLNHWVGHLDRNPQARTPNIDRLAARGLTFTNAHCPAPACEPSRVAIMGGRRPSTSGCFQNGQLWKNYQAPGEGLAARFLEAGYRVAGAGKIYHENQHHPEEWTEYMPNAPFSKDGPGVKKFDGYFDDVTHPDLADADLQDWHAVDYCIERLLTPSEQPFFLACGLYKPHLPFVVPRKYYDAFPLDSIELPPHLEDDLADVPPAGRRMALANGDHQRLTESGRWKAAIRSYLATCAYTDMNIGRLLDALDRSPHRDNTIVVLWTDHGWSFGEKQHWRKFALWEEATRTPYIWVVPGVTTAGTRCDAPVDLMTLYPTLCSLAELQKPDHVEGADLAPLLRDPSAGWPHVALTTHGRGNHSVRTATHRYIRYADGTEELYDHRDDPYEWRNLAKDPATQALRKGLARHLPSHEAESR